MVIKLSLLLAGYLLNTHVDSVCDQQLSDDHQMFITLTVKLS